MLILNVLIRYSKLVGVVLCSFSLGICLYCSAGFAANSTASQLDKLENKLFQHTYAKDETDNRIDRLEKLIFGESQKGSDDERISALVKAVPNLDSPATASSQNSYNDNNTASENTADASNSPGSGNSPNSSNSKETRKQAKTKSADNIANEDNQDKSVGVGNYPAVTAMETKLLGKDHSQEPIQDRLSRLEKKVLGSVSTSDDLSERVDKLKTATGIDITRKPGSLNDWIEDDDDMTANGAPGRGTNGAGFGQRDIYKDMQQSATGSTTPYTPVHNSLSSPYFPDNTAKRASISIKSFGLSQQVTALEHEIFAKSYEHDPLPARVNRLESAVFPEEKPAVDKSLPDRVNTLLAKVPIRQDELQHLAKIYNIQPETDDSLADTDNPNSTAAAQKAHGNLSKIINSLGNMLSGGMQGGYPMTSGQYVMDPNTGLLVNPTNGTAINPNTGTVYSTRSGSPSGMSNGYNNYNSNYNNMYPFGSPYGMGSGFGMGGGMGSGGMGMGGMGMGFGFR